MFHKPVPEASSRLLERIAKHLYFNADYVKDISLLNGSSGIALFFYYYSRLLNDQVYTEYADELFDKIYADLSYSENFDHASGICGIAVFVQHLLSNEFIISDDDDDVLSVVDENIANVYQCKCKETSPAATHSFSIANYLINRWDAKGSIPESLIPYVNVLVADLWREIAAECAKSPEETWQIQMRSVYRNEGKQFMVMNPSVLHCLHRLNEILPSGDVLSKAIELLTAWQERMLKWLVGYWEQNSAQMGHTEDYYWVEYFMIAFRYAKISAPAPSDPHDRAEHVLAFEIREGFRRMVSNRNACSEFHGNFRQGDPMLILIGKAMHRYTQDNRYLIYTNQLLIKYLEPHPFSIGGSSLVNHGAAFLSVNNGHAGIGLLLLAYYSETGLHWGQLLGHYDVSARRSEQHIKA